MKTRKYNGKAIVFKRARAEKMEDENGRIRVTLSTERVASDGHVIVQSGWNLSRAAPLSFLWSHNDVVGFMGGASAAPLVPIGVVEDLDVVETRSGPELRGWIRFYEDMDPKTGLRVHPLAYRVAEAYRRRYLTDVSVGFVMLDTIPRSEYPEDHPFYGKYGLVSRETLLLEASAVINGADRGAMVDLEEADRSEESSDAETASEEADQVRALPARYQGIDFSPPAGCVEEAKRGIDWYEDGHGGAGLVDDTIRWARKLARGEDITPDKARKMRAWLARHETDKTAEGFKPGEDGYPSPGRVAWALWCGDAGQRWSKRLVEQMERADLEEEERADMEEELSEEEQESEARTWSPLQLEARTWSPRALG